MLFRLCSIGNEVKWLYADFKCGRYEKKDAERSSHPNSAGVPEDSKKLHKLVDQKQQCADDSEYFLELFQRMKNEFLHKYVIMNETWIHHFILE